MKSETASMKGKVCLVTGASSGIGKEIAKGLARTGATAVMVGRNRQRAEAARDEIIGETANDSVELMISDFSSFDAVRRLAADFKGRHARLDVLVNNAGTIPAKLELSADGYEMQFAVNHLAYFLLTNLLLGTIKASAPARIVNTASGVHTRGRIDFDNLRGENRYGFLRAYGRSKLANILFTYELAGRLEGTGVTVNCFTPGMTKTDLGRYLRGVSGFFFRRMGRSPGEGAETAIYLATSPDVAGVTGKYFADCREARSSEASHDAATARRLWEVSEKATGLS